MEALTNPLGKSLKKKEQTPVKILYIGSATYPIRCVEELEII